jgi:hypothetical protein
MPKTKYAIDTKNGTAPPTPYILMETLPPTPYTTSDEINLVAYTTGIKRIHQGMDAYDFCGLRYAKTDPKQWQEKFKLPRFVYFSLRLE